MKTKTTPLERHLIGLVRLYSCGGHDVTCARIPGNGRRGRCDCLLGEQLRAARSGILREGGR